MNNKKKSDSDAQRKSHTAANLILICDHKQNKYY